MFLTNDSPKGGFIAALKFRNDAKGYSYLLSKGFLIVIKVNILTMNDITLIV